MAVASSRNRRDPLNYAVVILAALLVSALHYGTPRDPQFHAWHDVFRRLYYIPIVLGAFHFGRRGGILTALGVTALYLPHVIFQWGGMAHGNQYLEILMFNVIGLITGVMAQELKRKREEARSAYLRLQESFERAKEAERLAAMGQLSAALSHEIRNPLASLKGSLPILIDGIDGADPRHEFADIARREIGRLEELTSQFLEYARPPEPRWAEDSLNDVVRAVTRLVEREAARVGVRLEVELDAALPLVSMDSNRMRQVLLNLTLNGIQAMPEGGRLRLRTGHSTDEIHVALEDQGPGIDASIAARLFEPFVTTKKEGTGLGLAVAHQWVQRHGGRIEVGTAAGGGAAFTVHLPHALGAAPETIS